MREKGNNATSLKVIIKRAKGDRGLDVEIKDLLLGQLLEKESLREKRVLLKPNLLKAKDPLCVTSPEMILAISRVLKGSGAHVIVADSPAFGRAIQVIKGLGIWDELKELGVEVLGLGDPKRISLGDGIWVGVSKIALDADLIVNVPRLKAHSQMGITCGVKNLFGTVVGFRKAFYHVIYGGNRERFSRMLLALIDVLPSCVTVLDAICAMHVTGPSGGEPIEMNFIAGSWSPVALDTAIYEMLGARPQDIPLWHTALKKGIKGARLDDIEFPCLSPHEIQEGRLFNLPKALDPLRFSPVRFIKGRTKSLLRHLTQ